MFKSSFVSLFSAALLGGLVSATTLTLMKSKDSHAAGPNLITASEFRLVDPQGRTRAQLAFSQEGPPALFLLDEKGRARLVAGLYSDGQPHVVLNDAQSSAAAILRLVGPDSPYLIFKAKGQDRMIVGVGAEPFLVNYDSKGGKKDIFGKY